MKIDRVRDLIQNYSEDQLRLLIAEFYKALPKSVRDDGALDRWIECPDEILNKPRRPAHPRVPTLDDVDFEIEMFIKEAQEGTYFKQRKRRSNWRFQARSYFKVLTAPENQEHDPKRVTELLLGMYQLFCRGCQVYLFSGSDPFASVGVSQSGFIDAVLASHSMIHSPEEFIKFAIALILTPGMSNDTTTQTLIEVFQRHLKTPDMREMAVVECERRAVPLASVPVVTRGGKHQGAPSSYAAKERVNELATLHFFACAALCEYDRTIEFYKKVAHLDWDLEIQLYCILELLQRFDQKALWLREYDRAKEAGIVPREQTEKLHGYLVVHGEFPRNHSYLYDATAAIQERNR